MNKRDLGRQIPVLPPPYYIENPAQEISENYLFIHFE
jgi:hypothetical protein